MRFHNRLGIDWDMAVCVADRKIKGVCRSIKITMIGHIGKVLAPCDKSKRMPSFAEDRNISKSEYQNCHDLLVCQPATLPKVVVSDGGKKGRDAS